MQTIRDYLAHNLDIPNASFDYDELHSLMIERDDEQFDLFVRLAYNLSEMHLSPEKAKLAAKRIADLAVAVLTFNMSEGSNDDETIEAANSVETK